MVVRARGRDWQERVAADSRFVKDFASVVAEIDFAEMDLEGRQGCIAEEARSGIEDPHSEMVAGHSGRVARM